MNEAIELHDSDLEAITERDGTLVLALRVGIHKSDGVPGVDPGWHYVQDVELEIVDATLDGEVGDLPADILDGDFKLGDTLSPNMISLKDSDVGPIQLTICLDPDCRELTIKGSRANVTRVSEPTHLRLWR